MAGLPYAEVIGDPIAHSKSPLIHNFWLEKLGLEGDYRATRITAAELPSYLASRREDPDWRGCNLTMPLKQAAWAMHEDHDSNAGGALAVNLIVRGDDGALHFTNTDVEGISASLFGPKLQGARVELIGAGGAALAALQALRFLKPAEVGVFLRDTSKQPFDLMRYYGLKGEVRMLHPGCLDLGRADLLINATPLGMNGYPPFPDYLLSGLVRMPPGAAVFDMVYSPVDTELLKAARGLGLKAIDGLTMLMGQAAAGFEKLFLAPAPRQHDFELRKLLTS
jgi:shikimate dehydrogenase